MDAFELFASQGPLRLASYLVVSLVTLCVMSRTLLSYLTSYWSSPPAVEHKDAIRALPSNWYSSPEMYELERRAIFSRKWQLITHKVRLQKPGDWLRYDIAGFDIIICSDRQGNINGFHNVCRHRAYPVVTGEKGTASIFSCKYHGWSYGLNGNLAKAPGYQELPDFDRSRNSLFPLHVHVDCNGFIWINLDAKKTPEIAWKDDFDGIDRQERYNLYNFDDYVFDHVWQMEGDYNWKILADNYNECYHCATTHPDLPAVANLEAYSVTTEGAKIIHNPGTTEEQAKAGLSIAATYYFPNVSTNVSPHFFMVQRFVPTGPCKSIMRYEVFRNTKSTMEQFKAVDEIYKRVMSEDKALCDAAQKNLNAGVFVNGELHPRLEQGPLHFQSQVRDTVMEHFKKEQTAAKEIHPARQEMPSSKAGEVSKENISFCSGLACGSANPRLAW